MTARTRGGYIQPGFLVVLWTVNLVVADYHCHYQDYEEKSPADVIQPDVGEFGSILSVNYPKGYGPYQGSCQVHIKACYGCIIEVKFEGLLAACPHNEVLQSDSATCDQEDLCEYFIWAESGQPAVRFGENVTSIKVQTSVQPSVTLRFCYSASWEHSSAATHIHQWKAAFAILDQFTERVSGSAGMSGSLRSPNFPQPYTSRPATYFIQGSQNTDRIQIIFDDFDLDTAMSVLKIYDGLGRVNETSYRTLDERPFFVSTSHHVLVEFLPGQVMSLNTHIGFKATYQFISEDSLADLPNPIHHKCQPVDPVEGGAVLQAGPAPGSDPIYHDCLWTLRPRSESYISVQVLQFRVVEDPTSPLPLLRQLEIRRAFHSEGEAAVILYSESQLKVSPRGEVVSKNGLYIRLRAMLDDKSEVRFTYTPHRVDRALQPSVAPVVTGTQQLPRLCKAPFHRCRDGTCVPSPAHCVPDGLCHGIRSNSCGNSQCYTDDQQCDGIRDCSDASDELYCDTHKVGDKSIAIFVRSLSNTWFFFLPAVILVLTFVIGCVIYKTRKFRHLAQSEGYQSSMPGTEDIQLHTFTATAPPPYEEVATATNTAPATVNNGECEPPPAYEEITRTDAREQHHRPPDDYAASPSVALLVADDAEPVSQTAPTAGAADTDRLHPADLNPGV